ncbi:MAG TPA: glycosyltransferase [Candidatus Syntrophosphaera sp.]|nr:glycosyltransferase [Candidatus Syntrophosphaera sp.]
MSYAAKPVDAAVFLSGTGFPEAKTAYNHKLTMLGKALLLTGFRPIITSKSPSPDHPGPERGCSEGIDFLYFCPVERSMNKLRKIANYIRASYRELRYLIREAKRSKHLVLIISIGPPWQVMYYSMLRNVLKARLVASIMEYHVSEARGLSAKIKAVFFDHYSYLFCDGIMPISSFLADLTLRRNPNKPVQIVPVLADYGYFSQAKLPEELSGRIYFLFCAGVGYSETIEFCIRAFKQMNNQTANLVLILSGKKNQVDRFRVEKAKHGRIIVYNALPYDELFALYSGARALLIPLRENHRDEARFPQKIAEYLSSGRPIITNSFGEINHYFPDGRDACVLSSYDTRLYAEAMDSLVGDKGLADILGNRGRELGQRNFDYRAVAKSLEDFFYSLWRGKSE